MPKLPRLTPQEAEKMLLKSGFKMLRSKGSHRIYAKDNRRIVIPFHSGKILHPKIVKQVLQKIKNTK
ncbi:MAG: type II toxin-antitoxin system HicA family toxin [Candidatus Scalindua sediminis]